MSSNKQKQPAFLILRNLIFFIIVFKVVFFSLLGGDYTSFYNEKDFSKYAKITHDVEDYEGYGLSHTVTLNELSNRYQYAAAVLDFSFYEEINCTEGLLVIDKNVFSGKKEIDHLLIKNCPHFIVGVNDVSHLVKIYSDKENLTQKGVLPANEFYSVQKEYEEQHKNLSSILKNDYEHIMYKLLYSNTWLLIAILILTAFYYLTHKKKRANTHKEADSYVFLWYMASMIISILGVMMIFLLGEALYRDGGIMGLIFKLTLGVTGIGLLSFVLSLIIPLLIDRDFLFGFSAFCWKLILTAVISLISAGIGFIIYEIINAYPILQLVLLIGLLAALIYLFVIFVSLAGERSLIFQTYIAAAQKVSIAGETAADVMETAAQGINWKKTQNNIEREVNDIIHDDRT